MPKEAAEKNIHVLERNGKLGEVKIADERRVYTGSGQKDRREGSDGSQRLYGEAL